MLFWTKQFRIKNKQVSSKLTTIMIHEVISQINNTQHLAQYLVKQKTPIGYGSSEAEAELKLVDNECTKSTSQHKTEQTQEDVFVACL